jgi:hypothetical protein
MVLKGVGHDAGRALWDSTITKRAAAVKQLVNFHDKTPRARDILFSILN